MATYTSPRPIDSRPYVSKPPILNTHDGSVELLWRIVIRLSSLLVWLAIALAHVAAVVLLIAVLWWAQVTPQQIEDAALQTLRATTAAFLGFAGLSLATLLSAWVWLLRKLHRLIGCGKLLAYLLPEVSS